MQTMLVGVAVLLLAGPGVVAGQTAAAADPSGDAGFSAFLAQVEAAQLQLVNGRPAAFKAL